MTVDLSQPVEYDIFDSLADPYVRSADGRILGGLMDDGRLGVVGTDGHWEPLVPAAKMRTRHGEQAR